MNGIGIDYQSTATILALREGSHGRHRTRLVDDGYRPVIPHAADDRGAWGTAAYLARPVNPRDSAHTGPWLGGEETDVYWRGMRDRLFRYLGQLPPTPRGGYEVTIAVPDAERSCNALEVLGHAERAGFTQARVVSSTDALLCRWLATLPPAGEVPGTVGVITVGDRATCVAGYDPDRPQSADCVARFTRGGVIRVDGLGFCCWCEHLLNEVRRHLNEPPGVDEDLSMTDGAIEFAARLGRAGPDDVLEWTGPLHEQCFEPPAFTPRDCRRWPDVVRFAVKLRGVLRKVLPEAGSTSRCNLIVVGGLGAVWPFAADVGVRWGRSGAARRPSRTSHWAALGGLSSGAGLPLGAPGE